MSAGTHSTPVGTEDGTASLWQFEEALGRRPSDASTRKGRRPSDDMWVRVMGQEMVMTVDMFVTWILVGLLTGLLAGIIQKNGWHGLMADLLLGLFGSGGASWIAWALGLPPSAGALTTAAIALFGAVLILVAESRRWSAPATSAPPEGMPRVAEPR